MKVYVVRNKEGMFYRSIGYGGNGGNWVSNLDQAKLYTKLGQANGRCTYFFKHYPQFGCPSILQFEINVENAVVIDTLAQTEKRILKAQRAKLKREEERKIRQIDALERERAKIAGRIKSLQRQA